MPRQTSVFLLLIPLIMIVGCHGKSRTISGGDTIKRQIAINAQVSSKDSLTYEYVGEVYPQNNCENCDYAEVEYPYFKGAPLLNDAITEEVCTYMGIDTVKTTNLQKTVRDWVKDQVNQNSDGNDSDSVESNLPATTSGFKITVEKQQYPELLAMTMEEEASGGAHPNSRSNYFNWDIKANKKISLDDLLKEGYQDKLNEVAEKIFRKDENLTPDQSLEDYNFQDNIFALNDNFLVTPKGLSFLYNTYEIKPYMAGITELLIPYSKIRKLLKPHTVIQQFIK